MKYLMHIDFAGFDEAAYPIPPSRVDRSEKACVHTPMPPGYMDRYEWAQMAMKTHAQVRCPHCGLWAVWLPKREAREVNKADRAAERAFCRQMDQAIKRERRR